jgi:hypothetical protein
MLRKTRSVMLAGGAGVGAGIDAIDVRLRSTYISI